MHRSIRAQASFAGHLTGLLAGALLSGCAGPHRDGPDGARDDRDPTAPAAHVRGSEAPGGALGTAGPGPDSRGERPRLPPALSRRLGRWWAAAHVLASVACLLVHAGRERRRLAWR